MQCSFNRALQKGEAVRLELYEIRNPETTTNYTSANGFSLTTMDN